MGSDVRDVFWVSRARPFPKYLWGPLGWTCSARGCVLRVGAGDLSVLCSRTLFNPAGHGPGCQGCPEPPSLPGDLSGIPCALWDHLLSPVCLRFSCDMIYDFSFHGAKSLPRAPPSLLGVTTRFPFCPPATPGDWDLLGMAPALSPCPSSVQSSQCPARAELCDRNKH